MHDTIKFWSLLSEAQKDEIRYLVRKEDEDAYQRELQAASHRRRREGNANVR